VPNARVTASRAPNVQNRKALNFREKETRSRRRRSWRSWKGRKCRSFNQVRRWRNRRAAN